MDVDLIWSRYFYLYPFYRQVLELIPELTPAYIKKNRFVGEILYIVRHVGVVIGVARVIPNDDGDKGNRGNILTCIVIRETYRRAGYATMLFEYINSQIPKLQIQIPMKFKSKKLLLTWLASKKFPNKNIFFEN